ncbi:MAG: YoaK family protein, partial [Solirubrobacteraceae bacterium]
AVVSGVTDAAGFVGLGGAFSSVMTGNMVLLGLAGGSGDAALAARAASAIVAFILGCIIGTRLAGHHTDGQAVWPRSVTRALVAELAVFCVYAVVLQVTGGHVAETVLKTGLLACNAVALGIQSSAIQRFGVAGLSTTYLTGTLTTTVVHLTSRRPIRNVALNFRLLAALIGGAAVGGLVASQALRYTPLLQIAGVGGVILAASLPRVQAREDELVDA